MFGDRLKLARKKAGYSLRGLSDALDDHVTAQTLGKYERDALMPSSGVLFLIPRDHLVREIGEVRKALGYQELIQLKRMYRVSAAALLVRFKQVGVINKSTLAYAFQTFARGWRSTEPEPLEGRGEEGQHEVPRRFERLCYWALAEGLVSPSKAGELLQQPRNRIEQGLRGPAEIDADYRKCQRRSTCAPYLHV